MRSFPVTLAVSIIKVSEIMQSTFWSGNKTMKEKRKYQEMRLVKVRESKEGHEILIGKTILG